MGYILVRKRNEEFQMYYDRFRIDMEGEFRYQDQPHSGIQLPFVFESEFSAEWRMKREMENDPSWNYEIREYLR